MNVFDIEIKQERNGLVYLPNETTPFTGKFTAGFDPVTKLQGSEQNYKDGERDGKHTQNVMFLDQFQPEYVDFPTF